MHFQIALLKGYVNIYIKKKKKEIESTTVHCQETDGTELLQQQYRLSKTQRFIPDSVTNSLSRELICFVSTKDCTLAMKGYGHRESKSQSSMCSDIDNPPGMLRAKA